jgi:hypothetical protein
MTLGGNKDVRNDTFISAKHGISVIIGKASADMPTKAARQERSWCHLSNGDRCHGPLLKDDTTQR